MSDDKGGGRGSGGSRGSDNIKMAGEYRPVWLASVMVVPKFMITVATVVRVRKYQRVRVISLSTLPQPWHNFQEPQLQNFWWVCIIFTTSNDPHLIKFC